MMRFFYHKSADNIFMVQKNLKKPAFTILLIFVVLFTVSAQGKDTVNTVIAKALSLKGTGYRFGGTTPAGFDCSGFITYLYKPYVPGLPRISRDMAHFGKRVGLGNLLPGDLVFFATGKSRGVITHVALYIGNNAVIHSVSAGPERGVIVTSLDTAYWKKRIVSASRIIAASGVSPSPVKTEPVITEPAEKSPWNTFDGIIEGDFNLWLENDKNAFEEWKKNN